MITTNKGNNNLNTIALYFKDDLIIPMYINTTVDMEDVIFHRSNLWDYVDKNIFNDIKSSDLQTETKKKCLIAIKRGISISSTNGLTGKYFDKSMKCIENKIPSTFIAEPNCRFFPCPTQTKNQRDFIIVTGPSGSGKSWWAADYSQAYHYLYPEREIYLISEKTEDEAFDKLKFVNRVPKKQWEEFFGLSPKEEPKPKERKKRESKTQNKIIKKKVTPTKTGEVKNEDIILDDESDESEIMEVTQKNDIVKTEITPETELADINEQIKKLQEEAAKKQADINKFKEIFSKMKSIKKKVEVDEEEKKKDKIFSECLFVFDDIEHVTPDLRKLVYDFKAKQTALGRSKQVDIILCNHMQLNFHKTREELVECTSIVFFPSINTRLQNKGYLERYAGLNESQVSDLLDSGHRWVTLNLKRPISVVKENHIYLIKN